MTQIYNDRPFISFWGRENISLILNTIHVILYSYRLMSYPVAAVGLVAIIEIPDPTKIEEVIYLHLKIKPNVQKVHAQDGQFNCNQCATLSRGIDEYTQQYHAHVPRRELMRIMHNMEKSHYQGDTMHNHLSVETLIA
ncbi:hypothetical protein ACJX0J_006442 [Zea mays]